MINKMIKELDKIINDYNQKTITAKEGMERVDVCVALFTYGHNNKKTKHITKNDKFKTITATQYH